ncbi:hypothetical protein D3C72_2377250 [compost metagenome]
MAAFERLQQIRIRTERLDPLQPQQVLGIVAQAAQTLRLQVEQRIDGLHPDPLRLLQRLDLAVARLQQAAKQDQ